MCASILTHLQAQHKCLQCLHMRDTTEADQHALKLAEQAISKLTLADGMLPGRLPLQSKLGGGGLHGGVEAMSTSGLRVLSAVFMGMMSCGMTGKILEPPAASRSSTPCPQACHRVCRHKSCAAMNKGRQDLVLLWHGELCAQSGSLASHPDCHEPQRVCRLSDAVEKYGQVVVVVQGCYVHLHSPSCSIVPVRQHDFAASVRHGLQPLHLPAEGALA